MECVGTLDALDPLVQCVSRQLSPAGKVRHLRLPETNSIEKHQQMGSTHAKRKGVSEAAAASISRNSWADDNLHKYTAALVAARPGV